MTKEEKVLGFLQDAAKMPLNFEELSVILGVPESDRGKLSDILQRLTDEGKIIKTKRGRYSALKNLGLVRGKFTANERGFGFVIAEDGGEDVYISREDRNCALHHDIVLVSLFGGISGNRRSGRVEKIISRSDEPVVAEFTKRRKICFAVPDSKKIGNDIYIAEKDSLCAKDGDKVVVKITRWDNPRKNPEGKVIEILGKKTDLGMDILSVAKEHGLRTEFPPKVKNEALLVSQSVENCDLSDRLDLRSKLIITIDGEDAKDLDDAVSLEMKENGNFLLGVHIADVGHYVKYKSLLDKEAFKRGTSVYLTDRVIPMLPTELSNGICSLTPDADRLTLSVFMEIDEKGEVVRYDIKESVINSKKRMTYSSVTAICEGDKELCEKYSDVYDMLILMEKLKCILHAKRVKRGSVDFDFPETKVILDEKGKPIDVRKYEITLSNHIIEEFMIVANETVAEHMFWLNVPFLYRVHEAPDDDKIAALSEFIAILGYSIKRTNGKIHSKEFQKLAQKIKGTKAERIVSTMMLRSMQKAKYTHENMGHFGLSSKFYSHFTSPIRRYPDLVIHRIIKDSLRGKTLQESQELNDFVKKAGIQATDAEITAMEAERDCRDMLMAEYMENFVGEEFVGIISSITSFGMFVELENTVEGFVSLTDMHDDYYIFDDKTKTLHGRSGMMELKIRDEVEIVVIKADKDSRRIDFAVR